MRDAIGQSFLVTIIIFFIIAISFLFVGSIGYSKAFKIKNRIIDIIEENGGFNDAAESEISAALDDIGYQVMIGKTSHCRAKGDGVQVHPESSTSYGNYDYCVFKYESSESKNRPYVYYGVTTFMTIHIPIVHKFIQLPVYGETKTFGILE